MYWDTYITQDKTFDTIMIGDKPVTEYTFSFQVYEDEDTIVNLCVTIDRIGKIKSGLYCVGDFKTTSTRDVASYLDKYVMSAQLRFYVLACKLMAEREPESILGKIGASQMGAFIDGIFVKPKANDNVYQRSEVFQFSANDIAEFKFDLMEKIKRLVACMRSSYLPKEGIINGTCQQQWGLCKFWTVCKQSNPEIVQVLLKRDFVQRQYEPLKFGKQ
jgi:hypothetical protein